MAGNKGTYLEDALLNWVKGTAFPAAPANLYVALYTATPTDAGASGTEVTGGSYARIAIASSGWSAISNGANGDQVSNAGVVTFATPTLTWGTVGWFALYDAVTVGNEVYWNALTVSKTINSGDTVSFAIGALVIAED